MYCCPHTIGVLLLPTLYTQDYVSFCTLLPAYDFTRTTTRLLLAVCRCYKNSQKTTGLTRDGWLTMNSITVLYINHCALGIQSLQNLVPSYIRIARVPHPYPNHSTVWIPIGLCKFPGWSGMKRLPAPSFSVVVDSLQSTQTKLPSRRASGVASSCSSMDHIRDELQECEELQQQPWVLE